MGIGGAYTGSPQADDWRQIGGRVLKIVTPPRAEPLQIKGLWLAYALLTRGRMSSAFSPGSIRGGGRLVGGATAIVSGAVTLGGPIPGPLPIFPARQLVERRYLGRAGRCRSRLPTSRSSARRGRCIPISAATRRPAARTSTGSRTSSWTARSPSGRCSSTTATRATAWITRRAQLSVLSDSRSGRQRRRTGSKAAQPGNVDLRSSSDRHMLIVDCEHARAVRALQRLLRRVAVVRRLGRVLRHERERPAARRLDVGGRGGPRDPARASCGTTRRSGPARSATRFASPSARPTATSTPPRTAPDRRPGRCRWAHGCRLKASKSLAGFTPDVQRIFRAMQRYGLIVADNGSDMYISGTYDTRWNNGVLNPAFSALKAVGFRRRQAGVRARSSADGTHWRPDHRMGGRAAGGAGRILIRPAGVSSYY